ncbi:MAG: hypothetical protein OEV31_07340, partial [Gammaproteobacteria bacterium]|nr:hypothetical protein [Gammaproteobacteria bacterium]
MLAIRTIAGAIIYSINGDPLAGVKVKFLLVAADGKPTQAWDVANKVPAIGMLEVITGSNGLMPDVNLPPNDGLDRVTQYLCHADTPGFRPFLGSIPSGAGSLPWADFMAAGAPLTPAEISALQTHIADHANPHGVTKAQVGLGNADNTSDTNKPVSTAQAAADTATLNTARAYADGLVVGLLDDRGTYNASDNTWPAAGGSGVAGEILKGDMWYIGTGGTLGGTAVSIGDAIRALTDA